jgi:hypothetical protein
MKAFVRSLFIGFSFLVCVAPQIAVAGTDGGGTDMVPEPTALLVWAGLAGIGGLFFWRRNRDSD